MDIEKAINTLTVSALVLLLILRTVLRAGPTDPVSIAAFSAMAITIALSIFTTAPTDKSDIRFIIAFALYSIVHLLFADTSILTIGLTFLTLMFFIRIKYIKVNVNFVGKLLVIFFIVSVIFNFSSLVSNLFTLGRESSFKGFFENANTMGGYTTMAITATFLFIKDKKIRIALIALFAMSLISCKSRNALLFVVSAIGFYFLLKTKFSKYAPAFFFAAIAIALYYMAIIEPQSQSEGMELFGKGSNSAGRSSQILLTITHFPLTLFGVGYDVPDNYSIAISGYAIHNFYINTLYALGIVFMIFYILFIFHIYHKSKSQLAKAFLLSSHIYFLFEPGIGLSIAILNSIPIILASLSINKETYENRTLHPKLQYRRR